MKYLALLAIFFGLAHTTLAAQTYFVSGPGPVYIENIKLVAQYNRTLTGEPNAFQFEPTSTVPITVTLLVPVEGPRDVMASLIASSSPETPLAVLDGASAAWSETVVDPKTQTPYLKGPSFTTTLSPGSYEVRVWSSNNDASYAILFGDRDAEARTVETKGNRMVTWIVIGGGLGAALLIAFWRRKQTI